MSGLSVMFMNFVKNTNDVQASVQAKSEEMELRTSIRMILDDERYCRVSMAGNGVSGSPVTPVTFKKQNVDDIASEGLDIALYFSNQSGDTRSLKKFNGANNPGTNDKSKYGKLTIKSMKLIMNNTVLPGPNYPDQAGHSDIGILRAVVSRKTSLTTSKDTILDFDVVVGMATGQSPQTSGVTKLLTCTRKKDEEKKDNYGYPESCAMEFSHNDNGGPIRTVILNMDSGGLAGIRLSGNVNNDDVFRLYTHCSGGTEIDDYFKKCSIGFGWKDSTNNNNAGNALPAAGKNTTALVGTVIPLQTGGDVNADDSFYYRIVCPPGTNSDLDKYVKKKCSMCFAQADQYRMSPDNITCKKVQDTFDSSWGRTVVNGDVNADDAFFIGFYCEGEFSPTIKKFTY